MSAEVLSAYDPTTERIQLFLSVEAADALETWLYEIAEKAKDSGAREIAEGISAALEDADSWT